MQESRRKFCQITLIASQMQVLLKCNVFLILILQLCVTSAAVVVFIAYWTPDAGHRAVKSLAELRKLPVKSLRAGYEIRVDGYNDEGDGGGGIFKYRTNMNYADDDGINISPNAGVGSWLRMAHDSRINVKWFGANGNGTSNDAVAIVKAINAVKLKGGGCLYIPAGRYLITDHVSVDFSGFHMTGDGIGITTIVVGAWVDGIRISSSNYPETSSVLEGILIENLSIDGNREGYVNGPNDTYGNGINLNSVQNFFIRNVHVYNTAEQGIVSTYFGAGPYKTQSQASVVNCIVDMTGVKPQIGIGFEGHFSRCLAIGNRVAFSRGGVGIYFGNLGETNVPNSDFVCSSNVIVSTGGGGIGIRAETSWHSGSIATNVVTGFAIGIRADNAEGGDAAGLSVTGNQIRDFAEYGIVTSPDWGVDRKTAIVGNVALTDKSAKACVLVAKGTVLSGNVLVATAVGSCGVIATGRALIANNLIDTGGSAIEFVGGGTDQCHIANNILLQSSNGR